MEEDGLSEHSSDKDASANPPRRLTYGTYVRAQVRAGVSSLVAHNEAERRTRGQRRRIEEGRVCR